MSASSLRKETLDGLEAHIAAQLRLRAVLEKLQELVPPTVKLILDDAMEKIDVAVAQARRCKLAVKARAE